MLFSLYKTSNINTKRSKHPKEIHLMVTSKCNMKCVMCDYWRINNKRDELEWDDLKKLINQMEQLKIRNMVITGGEPLTRTDIFDFIELARSKNINVNLVSNGYLINSQVVENFKDIGLDSVTISIDGSNEKIHDKIRGVNGSFINAIEAVKLLKNKGIQVNIATVIMNDNILDLMNIAKMAESLDCTYSLQPIVVWNMVPEKQNEEFLNHGQWIKNENLPKLDEMMDKIMKFKGNRGVISSDQWILKNVKTYFRNPSLIKNKRMAGLEIMTINNYGDISVCWYSEPISNIIGKSIKEIWNSNEFINGMSYVRKCQGKCLLSCYYN